MIRRDKRGRRIGYNWWREYNMTAFNAAWSATDEAQGNYDRDTNQMEEAEDHYSMHPKPRFKDFLIANAGMNRDPETA